MEREDVRSRDKIFYGFLEDDKQIAADFELLLSRDLSFRK